MNRPVMNIKTMHRATKPEIPMIPIKISYISFAVTFLYFPPLNLIKI